MENLVNSKSRTIFFIDGVKQETTKDVIEKIIHINQEDDELFKQIQDLNSSLKIDRKNFIQPIKIILQTGGGEVYAGLGLYDVIKNSKTPIEIECTGKIMSMGIILTLSTPLRYSHPNTTFMIHAVSSGAFGQIQDMEDDVAEAKRLNDILFKIIIENTTITRDQLDDILEHKKNFFLTAEEALKCGLIKKII